MTMDQLGSLSTRTPAQLQAHAPHVAPEKQTCIRQGRMCLARSKPPYVHDSSPTPHCSHQQVKHAPSMRRTLSEAPAVRSAARSKARTLPDPRLDIVTYLRQHHLMAEEIRRLRLMCAEMANVTEKAGTKTKSNTFKNIPQSPKSWANAYEQRKTPRCGTAVSHPGHDGRHLKAPHMFSQVLVCFDGVQKLWKFPITVSERSPVTKPGTVHQDGTGSKLSKESLSCCSDGSDTTCPPSPTSSDSATEPIQKVEPIQMLAFRQVLQHKKTLGRRFLDSERKLRNTLAELTAKHEELKEALNDKMLADYAVQKALASKEVSEMRSAELRNELNLLKDRLSKTELEKDLAEARNFAYQEDAEQMQHQLKAAEMFIAYTKSNQASELAEAASCDCSVTVPVSFDALSRCRSYAQLPTAIEAEDLDDVDFEKP